MKPLAVSVLLSAALAFQVGCGSSRRTQRGAALGAATGAVVGGVIGNQSGNSRTGAAIGAAVGGVAGGTYANRTERDSRANSSADYYLSLMTPEEIDILKARARSSRRSEYSLTDYLTEQERANLRRRDAAHHEIGR